MSYLEPIIYGIIQGLTEFLPISSTAHLRVIPALLGWQDRGAAFTAVIQWGTLLACVLYFRADIARMTVAWLQGLRTGNPLGTLESRLAWMIIVGTVPVVICGLLLKKHIEGPWRSLYVISAAAIGLALLLLLAEVVHRLRERAGEKQKDIAQLSWFDAILIGIAQAVAIIPGASRSGVTITGGLFVGMTRDSAARFSFLLSLPAVFGAGLKELWDERHELLKSQAAISDLVIATVISGIIGYATIAFLLRYLKTHTTYLFIGYRVVLGVLLLVLLAKGVLPPRPPKEEDGKHGGGTISAPGDPAARFDAGPTFNG